MSHGLAVVSDCGARALGLQLLVTFSAIVAPSVFSLLQEEKQQKSLFMSLFSISHSN